MSETLLHSSLQAVLNAAEFLKKTGFKNAVSIQSFFGHVKKVIENNKHELPSGFQKKVYDILSDSSEKTIDEQKQKVLHIEILCKTNSAEYEDNDNKAEISQSDDILDIFEQDNNESIIFEEPVLETENPDDYFNEDEHELLDMKQWQKNCEQLNQAVQFIKGVGPALAQKLRKVSVETVEDLIKFFPRKYEDRRQSIPIKNLVHDEVCFIVATVVFSGVAYYKSARKRVYEIIVKDETGELKLKWFRFYEKQIAGQSKVGQTLLIYGQVKQFGNRFEMHHPDIESQGAKLDQSSFGQIVPVYRETSGVYQKTLRKIILSALTSHHKYIGSVLPYDLCKSLKLTGPKDSIEKLHYPQKIFTDIELYRLQKTFVVEELFFYTLSLLLRKNVLKTQEGIAHSKDSHLKQKLIEQLPFELTQDQSTVLKQILKDMASLSPMNKLLQGDVGSGKTIVALLASLHAIDNGSQVVFLAPTEVLCVQHYQSINNLLKGFDVSIELLRGKQKKSEKKQVLENLRLGKVNILIATHAVLEDDVEFKNLGLIVVDEQHRFGVYQRAKLKNKGNNPDVLVMSATPIPRTLALTMYGDLDVSQIKQLPQGRKHIKTFVCKEKQRQDVYSQMNKEVKQGRQVFIIYPLVEESEKMDLKDASSMAQELQNKVFPHLRVGLVHGRMKSEEKNAVMHAFEKHELDILVSTTVIEVGINIPNASIMLIEHPERFGLSQLHQLRGRVGRGEHAAMCFLLHPNTISQAAKQRLNVFASTTDGFVLAEEDLKTRGPGDFFGKEQSGFPNFKSALFPRDLGLLERVRQQVHTIISEDPNLEKKENAHLNYILQHQWAKRIELMHVS